ncbi:heavy metal translocating P-type ATPase [Lactococcus nasutitermitis]|uniref:P-type Cu(+) transporter n=1 Tax=Lactococcus nasutitermitis TaxID=1652957 RepID=A0ABV9JHL2_9LACT|nr:cation-translocating P-type ATPase [Lactococcus nasutitermitis]
MEAINNNPVRTQNFVITGMTCANCAHHISSALKATKGVKEATVNLATERARVLVDDNLTDEDIIKVVQSAGYGAIVNDKKHQEKIRAEQKRFTQRMRIDFIISAILTAPVLLAMFTEMLGFHGLMIFHNEWVQLILATPVQFIIGWRFFVGAYKSLRGKSANMDVLVALGTLTAYLSSIILGMIMGISSAIDFEASMSVITLVLLGKVLEHHAKEKTADALTSLMSARATSAHTSTGERQIEEIRTGEIIQIYPGEKVPLDAKILSGSASFDESNLTGESIPIVKSEGQTLFEGTVNLDGQLTAQVVHELSDSTISKMVEMMSEAQSAKPDIQKLADRISAIFVPVVIGIALVTLALTLLLTGNLIIAITHAVAVVVVSCPCALGLATPTAVMSGTGLAAKNGIIVKNALVLEQGQKIQTIFFDKTGTITTGDFLLSSFTGSDNEMQILASLEAKSKHPLAQSLSLERLSEITDFSETFTSLLEVSDFTEIAGRGVSGTINGEKYFAGNAKLMADIHAKVPETSDTVVYLAQENEFIATATFTSEIKAGTKAVITELRARGIKTVMLTGDNLASAKKNQAEVELDEVQANLTPEEKAKIVSQTENSMMVGDGINDTIAMAAATVSVAMASGSDIAMEAGDVTIIGNSLGKIPTVLDISHLTIRKIRQNYFWAFIYNTIGIPLAAFGVLSPIFAAAAMSLSSVSVITSSLLLARRKLEMNIKI